MIQKMRAVHCWYCCGQDDASVEDETAHAILDANDLEPQSVSIDEAKQSTNAVLISTFDCNQNIKFLGYTPIEIH